MTSGTVVKYQVQTGTSTVNTIGTWVTAMTIPLDTSADSGSTFYMLTYKFNTTTTGTFAAQDYRITIDGTTVFAFDQKVPDFFRVSTSPAMHSIKFEHRLKTGTAGATATVKDINLFITKL